MTDRGVRKIFIHHDGALGDVILSLPVLRAIRRSGESIHFAGRTDIGILLRECGLADETSSSGSPRYAPLYSGGADHALSLFLRTFERAFLFTVAPSSALAAALTTAIPAMRIIRTSPPEPGGMHASDYRLDQFAGAASATDGALLPVPLHYRELADTMLRRSGYEGAAPVIAVHPGSGSRSKSWPLERFFEVIDRLKTSTDPFILLLTGPAEDMPMKDRVEEFSAGRDGMAHVVDADLISVAALLNRSDLFIGNDSGTGHLAAAAGCPVLALFGPTDPELWAPRGSRVEVIRGRTLAEIDAERVYSRAAAMLRTGCGCP